MKTFGLSPSDFEILNNILIEPMKQCSVEVYVFGSRAAGKNHPFSDIDILYVLPGGDAKSPNISEIKESLEESGITIKVDLVELKDLASSYRDRVLRERVRI
jgi:predicted nucleotidyltransferase